MSGRTRLRSAGWVVGALVGVATGTGLALVVQDWQEAREASDMARAAEAFEREDVVPRPGDAVRELVAQDARVAVDPLLADRIPAKDRARAEEILASSPVPAWIAYLSYPDSDAAGYTTSGAAAQWRAAVGETGHYLVLWDTGSVDIGAVGLEAPYVEGRTQGQPGPALVRLAEEMASLPAEPLATEPDGPSDFDYWGGVGGGLAAGGLTGALVVVPVFLLLRWLVGLRRRKVT